MANQKRIVVGTTPVLLTNPNPQRKGIVITYLPTSIESGNTGRVHLGKGFPPSATLGDANQGDPIVAGVSIEDQEKYKDDTSVFKGTWWATASAASQILTVDEV